MKILNKILGTGLLALSLTLISAHKTMAQEYVSDQEFYDDLQPYGTWIDDPNYGNVWVPDVDDNFRPYASNGHWVQTDYGSTWVSGYPWGWATFHYGRWRYDDYYGWEWIPGHEWAPAWVSWRHGGGYYGWAPLTPGISVSLSFGGGYHVPDNYWVCAPDRYINRPNIYNYYVPRERAVTIIHNTTIINNTYVNNNVTYLTGPRPQEIERYTHQRVQVYRVDNASRPGANVVRNNTVNIYRPAIQRSPDAHPARVVNAVAYKQANPNQGIGRSNGGGYNRANAAKLATVARSSAPDNKFVKVNPVNNNHSGAPATNNRTAEPNQNRPNQPAGGGNRPAQPNTAGTNDHHRPTPAVMPGDQPAANNNAVQKQQQDQARQQQNQQKQQQDQARQQQNQQKQQQDQARQQQNQQKQQQDQARQQQNQQKQQQDQARQQQNQQKQQQDQARQQQNQQKQVQDQARQQQNQQKQQQSQQRQQQQQAQQQQAQQQQAQQRQQAQQQQAQQRQQQQQAQQRQQQQKQQQAQQRQQRPPQKPAPQPDKDHQGPPQ